VLSIAKAWAVRGLSLAWVGHAFGIGAWLVWAVLGKGWDMGWAGLVMVCAVHRMCLAGWAWGGLGRAWAALGLGCACAGHGLGWCVHVLGLAWAALGWVWAGTGMGFR
jgi:hypothetical protein